MYSRFPNRAERNVQIPEHYSGCAFSTSKQAPQEAPTPLAPPPPPQHSSETETPLPTAVTCDANKEDNADREVSRALRHTFGGPLSFFPAGMKFEEILLIGLILLLARSDQENDIILWLALLLLGK